ncbi:Glycosyl transferase [Vibrio chagasii]|nr:Glycosyl transferase [Vibrio chagasii]CAH6942252.1 Glycosyl transferase [Vibrio chagasii]CAH6945159.1 Glycosyl transferase [Vibrio chagasii]
MNTDMRKSAVLICVYKGDNLDDFKSSIDSIVSNSSHELRIYVHVDGSIQSNLIDYIDNNPNIYKIVQSDNNIGLAKGLNKLIDNLEDEEFVFRMDADDIVVNRRFDIQKDYMINNPEVDFCGGEIKEFEGTIDNVTFHRVYPLKMEDIVNKICTASPFAHVTICFRRHVFEKYGSYPESYPYNEDISYWLKLLRSGAVGSNLSQVLCLVRMDGAYERRTSKKAWPEFRVYFSACLWRKKFPFKPVVRLVFRFLPTKFVSYVYRSKLRNFVVKS